MDFVGRVDPALGNTCMLDPVGGSVSFYDTHVTLVPESGEGDSSANRHSASVDFRLLDGTNVAVNLWALRWFWSVNPSADTVATVTSCLRR